MNITKEYKYDVLVAGGGSAGVAAGIAAARRGHRVLLLEARESLGGYATNGYVHGIDGVISGIGAEIVEELRKTDDVVPKTRFGMNVVFDPEKGKLCMEAKLLKAGVRILYGVTVIDCEVQDGRIRKVIAFGKSGAFSVEAKVYIDATGDADLARAAKVPYETGAPEYAGLNMSSTQVFRLSHVNRKKYMEADAQWQLENPQEAAKSSYMAHMYREGVKAGLLPYFIFPTALFYPLPHTDDECADVTVNSSHSIYCRSDDTEDRTRQIIEQHQSMLCMERFFREMVPGFEDCYVANIAPMHGFRETRRIMGRYEMTDSDIVLGHKFDDAVCRFAGGLDVHHPTSREHGFIRHTHMTGDTGDAFVSEAGTPAQEVGIHNFTVPDGPEVRPVPYDWCEIPYRCLLPQDVEGLLVAGRCISASTAASSGTRTIGSCLTTGQAAGTAAALSIEEGVDPSCLDTAQLRRILIADGVSLEGKIEDVAEKSEDDELYVSFLDNVKIRKK